jgi:EAL domain-containing protein (putative c-di-GMP-specific phosphodiesterase class I)
VATQLSDCLPAKDTLYREGGDEFYLIHRGSADLLGVQMLIESIQYRFNAEFPVDDQRITVTASIGVALYSTDGETLEELSGNAAIAMARAKEQGGMTSAFFSVKLDHGVRTRFDLSQKLRNALARREFEVFYQPQIEAASGQMLAAEALLRWRSPELGFVFPAQFIPVAEETGHIVEIGGWVMRTVCQQIADWRMAGYGDVKVAVNLSAVQFMREDLLDTVSSALRESDIPPALLELEITESTIISDVDRAIATMNAIKAMGIALSLDDFGTGYSSLNYLKRFPLDYLKIDQSFVRDLEEASDAAAIVRSIIGLAHNLRIKVVAEGVETKAQRDYLTVNECDVLQGYLFSRPVPADAFLDFWQANRLLMERAT